MIHGESGGLIERFPHARKSTGNSLNRREQTDDANEYNGGLVALFSMQRRGTRP
jgi:hypothetical protein